MHLASALLSFQHPDLHAAGFSTEGFSTFRLFNTRGFQHFDFSTEGFSTFGFSDNGVFNIGGVVFNVDNVTRPCTRISTSGPGCQVGFSTGFRQGFQQHGGSFQHCGVCAKSSFQHVIGFADTGKAGQKVFNMSSVSQNLHKISIIRTHIGTGSTTSISCQ